LLHCKAIKTVNFQRKFKIFVGFSDDHSGDNKKEFENPIKRTGRILKNDLIRFKNEVAEFIGVQEKSNKIDIDDPTHYYSWQSNCDVLIIGGGVVGSSIAFFLEESFPGAMNVTVLEKDPTVS